MDEKTLFQRLSDYGAADNVSMHMPGHKRRVEGIDFLENLGARYDITEIAGFDDLHNPQGILAEAMMSAGKLWGSADTFFLVNGSTCGILAAIRACAKVTGWEKLIMARNCHKSVYNGAELCGLEPVFIAPLQVSDFGFCGSISPRAVELAVLENPGAPVVITSPTYEGILSNITEIAIICHIHGSPLIVDEAHGAHLDLSPTFRGSAIGGGADVVVQSLHKTLTGLTQTALLHLDSQVISHEDIARELSVFETSSPSYLLMASIDGTRELLESRGIELFGAWKTRLDRFDERVSAFNNLGLPGHGQLFACQLGGKKAGHNKPLPDTSEVYGFDRSKIIISCESTDTTGVSLMNDLRSRFGIECEMAAGGYAVAMTGLLDSDENMQRLSAALEILDSETRKTAHRLPLAPAKIPTRRLSLAAALEANSKPRFLRDARGSIAAEYVWAYPPGIPLVIPGEELTEELLRSFIIQREAGVSLQSSHGGMPKTIQVVV